MGLFHLILFNAKLNCLQLDLTKLSFGNFSFASIHKIDPLNLRSNLNVRPIKLKIEMELWNDKIKIDKQLYWFAQGNYLYMYTTWK